MTREEAIEALDEIFDNSEFSRYESWYGTAMDMAIEALSAEAEWIPCSERLPKARESVLLSTKEWTGEGCYWETTKNHVIWKGYRWNAIYWDDEVIAWMPLPKPYKGGEYV